MVICVNWRPTMLVGGCCECPGWWSSTMLSSCGHHFAPPDNCSSVCKLLSGHEQLLQIFNVVAILNGATALVLFCNRISDVYHRHRPLDFFTRGKIAYITIGATRACFNVSQTMTVAFVSNAVSVKYAFDVRHRHVIDDHFDRNALTGTRFRREHQWRGCVCLH